MPWWAILLIVIGSLCAGGFIGACGILLYIGKGMNW